MLSSRKPSPKTWPKSLLILAGKPNHQEAEDIRHKKWKSVRKYMRKLKKMCLDMYRKIEGLVQIHKTKLMHKEANVRKHARASVKKLKLCRFPMKPWEQHFWCLQNSCCSWSWAAPPLEPYEVQSELCATRLLGTMFGQLRPDDWALETFLKHFWMMAPRKVDTQGSWLRILGKPVRKIAPGKLDTRLKGTLDGP